jgi:hypothetical protein
MIYEQRRDSYLAHVRSCKDCVSSYSGRRKFFLDDAGFRMAERYSTVSQFCAVARELLDRIVP